MKKLLILLFSLLIPFNSFAGSADGKGLECIHDFFPDSYKTRFVWFEQGLYKVPFIEGYTITWLGRTPYREEGTEYIKFNWTSDSEKMAVKWWRTRTLDRDTLILYDRESSSTYSCNVLSSKQQVIDSLNKIIDDAKKTNKI
jgi:hypothetical protein